MKNFRNLFIILLLLSFSSNVKAQYSTYNGVGFSVGATNMIGDWGRSSALSQNIGYTGGSVEIHHQLKIVRSRSSIRTTLGFSYIGMKHTKEEWIDNPDFAEMRGTTSLLKLGTRYELNFFDYGLYYPREYWTPYVAIGIDAVYYSPKVETSSSRTSIPRLYQNGGIVEDPGFTAAVKGVVGVKFKLNRQLSFFTEMDLSRMFSDEVDGLMPEGSSTSVDYTSSLIFGLTYFIY